MLNLIISSFSNAHLMRFLSAQNSAFVGYEQNLSELIQDFEKFQDLVKIGEIEYKNTDKLLVFTCKYLGELTSRSSRKNQYEIAKKALKEDFKDGAVFVFYDEAGRFRFSFIRRNFGDKTNKFTPWKRYTYFVEPDAQTNRTFIERIGLCKFESLDAIQEAFSVEKLTKDFYKELFNWYFWAIKNVSFPNNVNDDTDDEKYNSENIIRLITRLIFVWFLKQKNLVNPELFQVEALTNILKNFEPESESHHQYYRAILQNLFFATLNQEIGHRSFAEDKGFLENRKTYSIKSLYRYENEFKKGATQALELFSEIPFLNGGLFECLDNKQRDGKVFDWDGFSRNPKHQAKIPNCLFFAKEMMVDLSGEYNDKKMKTVKVSGIIEILSRYNFTIEENTPVEIEVALDPELLGKVFENLLGAFNPETQETARKQTGSFYTPREIVHYMVDESLVSYYKTKVPDVDEENLRLLLSYDEQNVTLSEQHKEKLIQATFDCKILDPACGSGAFPMGVLQHMVHLLNKLDSDDNTYWNNVVMAQAMSDFEKANKLGDEDLCELKDAIEKTFDNSLNYPDYARKLHLIENCIYGIDIQTIAVQISKLRFFISLVCEQRKNEDASQNFGIRPLPNLETKFVAANTLIGIEKTDEDMALFNEDRIKQLIDKLQHIRHRQFLVTNVREKKVLREKDQEIRDEIENEISKLFVKHADELLDTYKENLRKATIELSLLNKLPDTIKTNVSTDLFGLESKTTHNITAAKRKDLRARIKLLEEKVSGGSDYSRLTTVVALAKQLTSWNPYDQNQSAPFFDPEWMFGLRQIDGGYFDVVIGNPPYVKARDNKDKSLRAILEKKYTTTYKMWDLYIPFIEQSIHFLKNKGYSTMIVPDTIGVAEYSEKLVQLIENEHHLFKIIFFPNQYVFDSASVRSKIVIIGKEAKTTDFITSRVKYADSKFIKIDPVKGYQKYLFEVSKIDIDLDLCDSLGSICYVSYGLRLNSEKDDPDKFQKKDLISNHKTDINIVKYTEGKHIDKYRINNIYWLEWNTERCPKRLVRATFPELYQFKKLLLSRQKKIGAYSIDGEICDNTIIVAVNHESLGNIKNSNIGKYYSNISEERSELIEISKNYSLKYILSIINSSFMKYYISFLTKGRIDVYPDDWKQIPIRRIDNYTQDKFITLVDEILLQYKNKNHLSAALIEQKLDLLVYHIYNFSYDEIKVIDPNIESKITEEAYNAIEI